MFWTRKHEPVCRGKEPGETQKQEEGDNGGGRSHGGGAGNPPPHPPRLEGAERERNMQFDFLSYIKVGCVCIPPKYRKYRKKAKG